MSHQRRRTAQKQHQQIGYITAHHILIYPYLKKVDLPLVYIPRLFLMNFKTTTYPMVLSKFTAAHAASERSRLIYTIESGAYDLLKYYLMAHLQ